MDKKEVLEFLRTNPNCFLATVDGGAPRVRAVKVYRVDEGGILIQTWKSKDVGKQLDQNPEVELCFNNYAEGIQIRVGGKVSSVEDNALKEQVLIDRPNLKKFAESGHEIALFCLEKGLAHIWTVQKNFDPKTFIEL